MDFPPIKIILISLLCSATLSSRAGTPFIASDLMIQFDDIPETENTGATAQVPTPYVSLGWNVFFVASPGNSILINPHSLPAGALASGDFYAEGHSNITVDYPDSQIKAIDLTSTWVACASVANLPPAKCVVRFQGYKAQLVGTNFPQIVIHDHAFQGQDAMEFVIFPRSFTGLSTVDVFVTVVTAARGQGAQLDDVRGILYQ
ncbi:MAG: hypothetical protein Q9195_004491 [Heterodermia aff. obscurata]